MIQIMSGLYKKIKHLSIRLFLLRGDRYEVFEKDCLENMEYVRIVAVGVL